MEKPEITQLKDQIRSQELTIGSLLRTLKELEKAALSIHQPTDPSHYEENCKVCESAIPGEKINEVKKGVKRKKGKEFSRIKIKK